MKVIALTGIRKMGEMEQNRPSISNSNDVLIEVKSIGVCGSDMHYYKEGNIGDQVVQFPFVVGHEFSGVIACTGVNVSNLKEGDRVAVDPNIYCGECDQCKSGRPHTCRNQRFMGCPGQMEGCNKPFVVMPAKNCFVLPENMSFDDGMLIEPLSIGVYAAKQAGDVKGLDIAIWGYGPIGMCVHESLKMNGVKSVMVSDNLEWRCAIAKKHGAELVVNASENDAQFHFLKHRPEQVDIAFECCGNQEALNEALHCIKPGGKLVIVGIPDFDSWLMSADILRRREITVVNIRRQNQCEETAIDALSSGKIDLSDMITHRAPLCDAGKIYEMVADYKDGVMKAVLYP
ncbi:MAG: alcohol dehydrogenase catalytic domain-containing protein [Marinilabiliaceae bacterium]|nr:alcohol dehydrogenase catalytic domain-containing protein [Marinilabiliaceae bacterium]